VIKPGETRVLGPYTGKFSQGVHAILRIYGGTPTIEEMLAFARSDPDRWIFFLCGKECLSDSDVGGRPGL